MFHFGHLRHILNYFFKSHEENKKKAYLIYMAILLCCKINPHSPNWKQTNKNACMILFRPSENTGVV